MSFTHIIFRTLYALVSRPSCSTGKATDRHRKTPYRAAQRFSAWVHASEKNPEVYIFRAASLDRCTESGSGQQSRVRNFVPALCKGVALRYSLLHYPISGCPPELRPCRLGLDDKLTGRTQTPPQAPQSRLAFPLVLFRKSRQNGSEGSTGLF